MELAYAVHAGLGQVLFTARDIIPRESELEFSYLSGNKYQYLKPSCAAT